MGFGQKHASRRYTIRVPARTDVMVLSPTRSDKRSDSEVRSVGTVLVRTNASMGVTVVVEVSSNAEIRQEVSLSCSSDVLPSTRGSGGSRGVTARKVVVNTLGPGCIQLSPEVRLDCRALSARSHGEVLVVMTVVEN